MNPGGPSQVRNGDFIYLFIYFGKEMAGHGRKSHILAKVMLEAIYLDLNLGSATFCVISNQFVSDSTSSHQLNRRNSSLQRLLKAVREIM